MIPLLVRPRLQSLRNRWVRGSKPLTFIVRDSVVIVLGIVVCIFLYHATFFGVQALQTTAVAAYFPTSLPLSVLLLSLFGMLVFANGLAALGSFYSARDLDLLLASSYPRGKFFFGRLLDIFLNSSWLPVLIGLPTLLAYGIAYSASWLYFISAFVSLVCLASIATATAALGVFIFTAIIPVHRTREVLVISAALVLVGVYFIYGSVITDPRAVLDTSQILGLLKFATVPQLAYSPSYWASLFLTSLLEKGAPSFGYALLLLSTTGIILSVSFIAFCLLHRRGYSMARTQRGLGALPSRQSHARLKLLAKGCVPQTRAILGKEIKSFARDMTHAVQLVLLLCISLFYLYNFRAFGSLASLAEESRVWWEAMLVLGNIGLSAFVMTAVATRFVFPSISLEGQSFWVLQTAPISLKRILRAKFWSWFIPIATIASVIFASGALALHVSPEVVALHALASCLMCVGIVGMSVGLGAFFANFEWEHTSQLAAGFGTMIFMVLSILLVVLGMLPTAGLVFLSTLEGFGLEISRQTWIFLVGACLAVLFLVNWLAARWAMKVGELALKERML